MKKLNCLKVLRVCCKNNTLIINLFQQNNKLNGSLNVMNLKRKKKVKVNLSDTLLSNVILIYFKMKNLKKRNIKFQNFIVNILINTMPLNKRNLPASTI